MNDVIRIHDASDGRRAGDFESELREGLRSAPWLLVSLAAHVAVLLIAAQFDYAVASPKELDVVIVSEFDVPLVDPTEDPPPPPDPVEPRPEPSEDPLEDPVITDTTTDSDDNAQETLDSATNEAPFDSTRANDVLGLGGNPGGKVGGKYGKRFVGRSSGSATQRSVALGLRWLARHQDPSGYWSCADFSRNCAANRCDGAGHPAMDVGVTGLALLAFLGAGNTPNAGEHRKVVRRGLKWLVDHQDTESGLFGERGSHEGFLYDHALATLAVCEGYGLSKQPQLREPAQRGIRFIELSRNPNKAWRYASPGDGGNDLSVTGWMVLALKSASDFGLEVDARALDEVHDWIDSMTDEDTGRAGYLDKGGYSSREPGLSERWPQQKTEAMTAVAMLCRSFLGEDPERSSALRNGANLLRKRLPEWNESEGTIDMYYWYYGSYAMYQLGGSDWEVWQSRMVSAVARTQRQDGDEAGSWDPQYDPWGHRGGRVYSTAILTLCLEAYYRYDRNVLVPPPAPREPR